MLLPPRLRRLGLYGMRGWILLLLDWYACFLALPARGRGCGKVEVASQYGVRLRLGRRQRVHFVRRWILLWHNRYVWVCLACGVHVSVSVIL